MVDPDRDPSSGPQLSVARFAVRGGISRMSLRALVPGAEPWSATPAPGDGPYRETPAEDAPRLYDARFTGPPPAIDERPDQVIMTFGHGWLGWLDFRDRSADVALSPTAAWRIDVTGGVHDLDADLTGLDLREVQIVGGVHHTTLRLPTPTGTSAVQVRGGIHHLRLHRPAEVPLRVRVRGGVHSIDVDRLELGGGTSSLDWESPGFRESPIGYDIEILGGIHHASLRALDARPSDAKEPAAELHASP